MKKIIKLVIGLIIVILLFMYFFPRIKYDYYVKKFETVSENEYINLKNKDGVFIFGRKSCSDCRKWIPIIYKENDSSRYSAYYIDTEDIEKNQNLKQLVAEYQLKVVPTIVKIKQNHSTLWTYENGIDLNQFLSK